MKREVGLRNVIIGAFIIAILIVGANALSTASALVNKVNAQQNSFYTELEAELEIDY